MKVINEWAVVWTLLLAVLLGTITALLLGPVVGGSVAIFVIGMGLEKIYPIVKPQLRGATRIAKTS